MYVHVQTQPQGFYWVRETDEKKLTEFNGIMNYFIDKSRLIDASVYIK